jgi:hypothetical protein
MISGMHSAAFCLPTYNRTISTIKRSSMKNQQLVC